MNNIFSYYYGLSIQARAAFWFTVCTLLQKGIAFLVVPIFTRLLSVEEYGIYSLYLSWLQILTIVSTLNLHCGVFDNGMCKFELDRDKFISCMQGLTITITTGLFAVYWLFQNTIADMVHLMPCYFLLMFIEMYARPAMSFWSSRKRYEYDYVPLIKLTLAKSFLNPVLGIIFVYMFSEKDFGRILSVCLLESTFAIYFMYKQFYNGKSFYDLSYWKYALGLAIPLLPHYLSGTILVQGDRILIGHFWGSRFVAIYSIAYSIGMIVQILTSSISSAMTPWFYNHLKEDKLSMCKYTINKIISLVAMVIVSISIVSPELVYIFSTKEYYEAVYIIPIISASVFFIFLYLVFSMPQFYFEKTKFIFLSSCFAAIVNVVLNWLFLPLFGYTSAAYTTLFSYILYALGHYYTSAIILRDSCSDYEVFDFKFISILSCGIIVISLFIYYIYPYRLFRVLIFIIGLTAFVKNYKKIKNMRK